MKGALLLNHLLATLPDSLSSRKALMVDALAVFPVGSPLHTEISIAIRTLENHEENIRRIQSELPLNLES